MRNISPDHFGSSHFGSRGFPPPSLHVPGRTLSLGGTKALAPATQGAPPTPAAAPASGTEAAPPAAPASPRAATAPPAHLQCRLAFRDQSFRCCWAVTFLVRQPLAALGSSAAFLPASCAAISRQHRHSRPLLFQVRALSPPLSRSGLQALLPILFKAAGASDLRTSGDQIQTQTAPHKKKTPSAGLSRQGRV